MSWHPGGRTAPDKAYMGRHRIYLQMAPHTGRLQEMILRLAVSLFIFIIHLDLRLEGLTGSPQGAEGAA